MSETYILKQAVEIATGGQSNMIGDIVIQAPTGKLQGLFSRLEAEYGKLQKIQADEAAASLKGMSQEDMAKNIKLFKEIQDSKDEDEVEEVTEKDFLSQVLKAGFNLNVSYTILKELLIQKNNGAEMVSEEGTHYKLESGHWDKLPMKEIRGLLAFYIVNFIAGSD